MITICDVLGIMTNLTFEPLDLATLFALFHLTLVLVGLVLIACRDRARAIPDVAGALIRPVLSTGHLRVFYLHDNKHASHSDYLPRRLLA